MSASEGRQSGPSKPPPAEGRRLAWRDVPRRVRQATEAWLGNEITNVSSRPTGFSPGVAARLSTADGRHIFVKAAGPTPNPGVPAIHRQEARVVKALPAKAPVPRLLWTYDEGEGGWVLLAFEDVDGRHPLQPWTLKELDRVLRGLTTLAALLTPSPLPVDIVGTTSAAFRERLCGWKYLQNEHPSQLHELDSWSVRNLDRLMELEAEAPSAVAGETLLHFDVRADNVLLARQKVWFVDWPLACIGAPWVDPVFFTPSVTMQGGPEPEDVIAQHPACEAADRDAITAAVVAIAGFFTHRALQPPPPGLPTVRAFQAAQGAVAREWVSRRTGWD